MEIKTFFGEYNFEEVAFTHHATINFSKIGETVSIALNKRLEKCAAALEAAKNTEVLYCTESTIQFKNGTYFSKPAYEAMENTLSYFKGGKDFESILNNSNVIEIGQMLKAVALYDGPVKFKNKKQVIDLLFDFFGHRLIEFYINR